MIKTISKNRAFTLVETLVVLGIIGLVYASVVQFQVDVQKNNKYSSDSLQSAQDAQSILRTMVKELRSTKPANTGAYPIAQAATSSITFFSDIDADGLQEQIRYFLSTTTLKKGVTKPTGSPLSYPANSEVLSTLAYNIKNATSSAMFEYFDNTYAGTSSPMTQPVNVSSVRLIRINLLIDADPNRSPLPRLYTSDAMLRNLKDNL